MKHIEIVSAGFHAEKWAAKCIESVARQRVPKGYSARHTYVACDQDTMNEASGSVFSNSTRDIDVLVFLRENAPSLDNLSFMVDRLPRDTIVLWLDGDDWLPHDRVVERVVQEYSKGALATYGSFVYAASDMHPVWPGWASEYPKDVVELGTYRHYGWRGTHLKTFCAGLFQDIDKRDLKTPSGEWCEIGDLAVMFPILEMSRERAVYIPDILYCYNWDNPLSVHHEGGARAEYIKQEAYRIRSMPAYPRNKAL